MGLSPDIVVECTGVDSLVQQAAAAVAPGGIVCLTGVGAPSATPAPASTLATDAVLKNLVLFGSVNANRRHYYRAAKVLAEADRSWLEQLITRRVGPDDVDQALARSTRRHQGRHRVRAALTGRHRGRVDLVTLLLDIENVGDQIGP